MQQNIKILIVEDNMLIAAKISMLLEELGYEVLGLMPRAEEALSFIQKTPPDILLLDIKLKGEMDGVELAELIQKKRNIPIIYLTSNSDEATFNRAKATRPYAFISKPYKKIDLKRAITLTLNLIENKKEAFQNASNTGTEDSPFILNDRIFVRHKERMVKIFIKDILYIEAERNYSRIFTKGKAYILAMTLKIIEEKLSGMNFLRIHRSFIINISQLDEISERFVIIEQKAIPIGKTQKNELLNRLKKL